MPEPEPRPKDGPAENPRGHPPRILIVDDEPLVAKVVGALLTRVGYEVRLAGHPDDAMTLLDDDIDAILIDFRLPGMRGDAFYFFATARHPRLARHAALMTGDPSEQTEEAIFSTGCPWLNKPFTSDALYALIARIAPFTPSSSAAS